MLARWAQTWGESNSEWDVLHKSSAVSWGAEVEQLAGSYQLTADMACMQAFCGSQTLVRSKVCTITAEDCLPQEREQSARCAQHHSV